MAHVEAGLSTATPMRPFPEEPFRRRIAPLARRRFERTRRAAANPRIANALTKALDSASITPVSVVA